MAIVHGSHNGKDEISLYAWARIYAVATAGLAVMLALLIEAPGPNGSLRTYTKKEGACHDGMPLFLCAFWLTG